MRGRGCPGSNAIDGSLVVCVERMRDVLEVNGTDGYVETQPGIMNTELRDHVREHGLWYAPDPASKDFCSIGGNVNTNAGGLCCVKYGVTRDAVLGLEVVLADGRVARLGRRTIKGVAGYDLVGMMVGSEGTLGIVTMARLRLRPLPPPATTAVAVFDDVVTAGRATSAVMAELTPSMLPYGPADHPRGRGVATDGARRRRGRPAGRPDRPPATARRRRGRPPPADLRAARRARGAPVRGRRWRPSCCSVRAGWRSTQSSSSATGCSTTSRCRGRGSPRRWRGSRTSRSDTTRGIGTFGHAGDGNLHPTMVTQRGDEAAAPRAMLAFDDMLVVALARRHGDR